MKKRERKEKIMKGYSRDQIFSGIRQVESSIEGHILKVPLFYRDSSVYAALFPARISALKNLLPDSSLRPVRLMPGIGVVSLVVLQNRNTDIHEHNAAIIGIALRREDVTGMPLYNLAQQMQMRQISTYVLHMPVTTEIAHSGSAQGYGFNSFLASIDIVHSAVHADCTISQGGTLIGTITGRKTDAFASTEMKAALHSYHNGQVQCCEVRSVALQYRVSLGSKNVELNLGSEHPVGRELNDLLVSRHALMYLYAPRMQAVIFGPERLHPQLVKLGVESFFPQARLGEKEERRHSSRERVDIPCEVDGSSMGRKSHAEARLRDLSGQGMFIETGTMLDEGTEMRAFVRTERIEPPLWLKGRVTRSVPHGAAIRFFEELPEDLNRIMFH